jgi:hypothetical protein
MALIAAAVAMVPVVVKAGQEGGKALANLADSGLSAGEVSSPPPPPDPNDPNKHERLFRRRYQERGYEQPFGDSDQSIGRSLGIKGRVADHVLWEPSTNRWIVAESKAGSDVSSAVEQLANTSRALFNSGHGANSSNTHLIFHTNRETLVGLLQNQPGSTMYGGYSVQNGFLAYWDVKTGTWIHEIVNGVRISVVVP